MKRFVITITEILTRNVCVAADSEEAAIEKVQEKYEAADDDNYILDADDLEDTTFTAAVDTDDETINIVYDI